MLCHVLIIHKTDLLFQNQQQDEVWKDFRELVFFSRRCQGILHGFTLSSRRYVYFNFVLLLHWLYDEFYVNIMGFTSSVSEVLL